MRSEQENPGSERAVTESISEYAVGYFQDCCLRLFTAPAAAERMRTMAMLRKASVRGRYCFSLDCI